MVLKALQAPLVLILLFSSCSRNSTTSLDELHSSLTSAAGLASETETFIDYLAQDRATRHYAEGHLEYLADEINQVAKELQEAGPPASNEPTLPQCRQEVDFLRTEVTTIRSKLGDPEALAASKSRIMRIRSVLQKANSSL